MSLVATEPVGRYRGYCDALVRDQLAERKDREPGVREAQRHSQSDEFSPELWFENDFDPHARVITKSAEEKRDIAGKVNHLFEVIRNEKTGEAYTNAEVARRSLGGLTGQNGGLIEEEIRRLRSGEIPNPSVKQVAALANFFGVQPSYFVDSKQEALLLDEEAISALEDDTTSAILHKSIRLPRRERGMILTIIQQFENLQNPPDTTHTPEKPS